jgi:hypothetical protein
LPLQINEAKKERNKAILSKEDYKARCKAADEKLKDIKAEKEAVKKSLMRKVGSKVEVVFFQSIVFVALFCLLTSLF